MRGFWRFCMGGRSGLKGNHGNETLYAGREAYTETYEEYVNGIKVIRTRTKYGKIKRRKKKI